MNIIQPTAQDTSVIDKLANNIYTHRRWHPEYGHYLLEKMPTHHEEIAHQLYTALQKNWLMSVAQIDRNPVAYSLLKSSLTTDTHTGKNMELSFRSLKSWKWICTRLSKDVIHTLHMSQQHIHDKVIIHHAAANIGSGIVAMKLWCTGKHYHDQLVILPNLDLYNKQDTIQRELDIAKQPHLHIYKLSDIYHKNIKIAARHEEYLTSKV